MKKFKRKGFTLLGLLSYIVISSMVLVPSYHMMLNVMDNMKRSYGEMQAGLFVKEHLRSRNLQAVYMKKHNPSTNDISNSPEVNGFFGDNNMNIIDKNNIDYGDELDSNDIEELIENDYNLEDKYGVSIQELYTFVYTSDFLKSDTYGVQGLVSFKDSNDFMRICYWGNTLDNNGDPRPNSKEQIVCELGALIFQGHGKKNVKGEKDYNSFLLHYSPYEYEKELYKGKNIILLTNPRDQHNYY